MQINELKYKHNLDTHDNGPPEKSKVYQNWPLIVITNVSVSVNSRLAVMLNKAKTSRPKPRPRPRPISEG